LAVANLRPHPRDRQCQSLSLNFVLFEQMERKAKGCLFSYARQAGNLSDGVFYKFGGEIHE
jgi:hypothetical protein